ncbi:unnamed protein product [Ostreobium quekettii]|uniref:Uncharacterized protein n=1 Tax=Ostreobium quekettii TaxID=121088 RepID=A0A8S1J263_9CHLO|nr:unnamed protein product [Ostreobium quekettii]
MASAGATGANNVAASTGASTTGGSVPATNGGCPEGTMASASASVGDDVSTADACVPIEDMDDTTTDGAAPDSVPAVEDIGTGELAAAGAVYVSLAAIVGSVALGMAVL